jgi:Zn-finger nucleic acid-binding protein
VSRRPTCPACLAPLQVLEIGAVELDRCFTCGGLWFNRGELETLSGRGLTVVPDPTAQATHRCVFCGALMQRCSFRNSVAQSCPGCDAVFLPESAVAGVAGQELKPGQPEGARFKVTFVCAGACGDRYELARAVATARGLACSSCAPALPEEKAPRPPRDDDGKLRFFSAAIDLLFS